MFKHSKLALAALVAIASSTASAQTSQEPQKMERVVVTGSNIKRLAAETASPVQVISRTEIKQTGANTVRQVLDTITATTTNELRDDGSGASFAAGATGASLRGLGKAATLILLNGRRIANFALADGAQITFANTDSIPADAIQRIEILKDGASAVYGSDAMAGVINIIMRSDYQGFGLSASYQNNLNPEIGAQSTLGAMAGFGDFERDGFSILANIDAYKRDGYFLSDIKDYYPEWHKRIVNPAFADPSLISNPGNLFPLTSPGVFGSRRANPACPATSRNSANACVLDVNGLNQQSDPAQRLNFYSAARVKLGTGFEGFAELSYSKNETDYLDLPFAINAPGTPYRWFDGNARVVQVVSKPLLSATNPANNTGVRAGIEYRFTDDLSMWSRPAEASQHRVLAGLRGTFGGWDWESSIGRLGADGTSNGIGAHRTDFINAIESGEYKIGEKNSAELLSRMFRRTQLNGENATTVVDVKASGELFQLPGGPVMAAFGGEVRDEEVKIKSSDNLLAAEIIGRGSVWTEGSRKLGAVFGELEGSLFKGLTLNTALRFDKASGFDGRVSPKFAVRWEVLPGTLLLRGTAAGGFRAPNIPESQGRVGLTGFFNNTVDPKRCATATAIRNALNNGDANDRADGQAAFNSGCVVSLPAMISSNPAIKPELSRSATFGFVFDPAKNFSVAMDYFKIERRDEISFRDPDFVLAREDVAPYSSLISRGPVTSTDLARLARAKVLVPTLDVNWGAGELNSLVLQYENFGKTESSGIDLDGKWRINAGEYGSIDFNLTTTFMLTMREWDIDAGAYRPNRVGNRNAPRIRGLLSTAWNYGDWSYNLRFNYTSATSLNNDETDEATWSEAACRRRLNPGDLPCNRGTDIRVDAGVRYSGIKNLMLGLNIGNLTGDHLPVNLRDGFGGTTGFRPRNVKVSAEYKF